MRPPSVQKNAGRILTIVYENDNIVIEKIGVLRIRRSDGQIGDGKNV